MSAIAGCVSRSIGLAKTCRLFFAELLFADIQERLGGEKFADGITRFGNFRNAAQMAAARIEFNKLRLRAVLL